MPSELGPIGPTIPWNPGQGEYLRFLPVVEAGATDSAVVYLDLQPSGEDIYDPGCLIIGEGEAQLRWLAGDQQLRWLGYDANLRWEAVLRLGTGHC